MLGSIQVGWYYFGAPHRHFPNQCAVWIYPCGSYYDCNNLPENFDKTMFVPTSKQIQAMRRESESEPWKCLGTYGSVFIEVEVGVSRVLWVHYQWILTLGLQHNLGSSVIIRSPFNINSGIVSCFKQAIMCFIKSQVLLRLRIFDPNPRCPWDISHYFIMTVPWWAVTVWHISSSLLTEMHADFREAKMGK